MCKHFPEKFIKMFVKGTMIDPKFDVLAHVQECEQCAKYYGKVGGKYVQTPSSKIN